MKPIRSVIRKIESPPTAEDFLPNSHIILDCTTGILWHLVNGVPTQMGGAEGPQGPQGGTGPAGAQGVKGDKGDKGDTGAQGTAGADGAQGPQGETGPAGADGENGAQGAQGEQGIQGVQGVKGDTGETGPQGPQGDQGPQGEQGPAGSGGADIKSGLVNLTAGGSANVTFPTPFASTPRVVVTSQTNNADTSCTYSAHSVTANGFSLRGAGNPAGNVAWIATTAGNA